MKKIVLSVALLAIVFLMSPVFISKMVSTKYAESLEQLAANPSIEVVESQFTPQWFSAQGLTTLRLMGNLGELYPYDIVLKDDILFGPIIFADGGIHFNLAYTSTQFVLEDNAIDEELIAILKDKLSLRSKVTYGLSYIISWDLKEITKAHKENNLIFGEMQGEVTITDSNQVQGEYTWQGLTFTSPDTQLEVKGLQLDIDLNVVAGNLYKGTAISTGEHLLSIPEIHLSKEGKQILALKELFFSAQTGLNKENLLHSEMLYQIADIKVNDLTFKNLDVNVLFKRFDLDALTRLNTLLISTSQAAPEEISIEQINEATQIMNLLLLRDPEIEIKALNVETPDGSIESDALIAFNKAQINLLNPMALLSQIEVDAKGEAPKLFLDSMEMTELVELYTSQGFLRHENGKVTFILSLKNREITLNDLVFPL